MRIVQNVPKEGKGVTIPDTRLRLALFEPDIPQNAATLLRTAACLGVAVDIVSIGGVMASDPGLHFVRRLYHLHGDGDHVQHIGAVMFPERWRAMAHSEWNRARREGRIVMMRMEAMLHAGPRGYFGLPKRKGVSNNDRTLDAVIGIISRPAAA